ncbi:MAG TPA: hypothetical protein VNH22_00620 [Blastocatellia bacterium]|jgi:homoserine dehydrogenase|nr:hypothetical protein [Blastocatellia bacterium]
MAEIKVALLGVGNVGRSFADYIGRRAGESSIRIQALADSSGGLILHDSARMNRLLAHKVAGGHVRGFAPGEATKNAEDFIASLPAAGIHVLVESLPTAIRDGQPALGLLLSALERRINVVTVDKGPLVHGFEALREAGRATGAGIAFTGTTGVSVPEWLDGERVVEIRGVLNGTTNHILTEMEEQGKTFQQALADARAEGIAEPDPRLDVEGWDTACKIMILAKRLMKAGGTLNDVSRIGIGPETESLIATGRETGRIVRLVGRARIYQGRVRLSVTPKLLNPESPFYAVRGTSKAATFRTASGGEAISHGLSGRDAIAEVILGDILRLGEQKAV